MTAVISDTEPSTTGPNPWKWIAISLLAVVLLAGIAVFAVSGGDDSGDDSAPSPAPADGPTAALTLATREVAGQPRGFPKTEDGAIEAATQIVTYLLSGPIYGTDEEYLAWANDVFLDAETQNIESADPVKAESNVAPDGTYTGPDGWRAYSDCLPELGAYRSEKITEGEIRVHLWMPCMVGEGPIDGAANVPIVWFELGYLMTFQEGDWRTMSGLVVAPEGETPVPADRNRPETTFKERLQVLGPDWKLFADASEAWPTALLGEDPKS